MWEKLAAKLSALAVDALTIHNPRHLVNQNPSKCFGIIGLQCAQEYVREFHVDILESTVEAIHDHDQLTTLLLSTKAR